MTRAISTILVCLCTFSAFADPALHRALAPLHEKYDSKEQMLAAPFSSPGYHTTLTGGIVHRTRESFMYAVACLDTGDPKLIERGGDILRRCIALQDQNPASKTYGIWSWFLEEPLDKMSPPDWNWADFNGRELLQVVLRHRDKLPADLMKQVESSLVHACNSIKKRNVGPGYTNIAILGTYVTLVTGETLNLKEMRDYGLDRLKRFAAHTEEKGGFSEYNSPTYTMVSLIALGQLKHDVKSPEAKQIIDSLYLRSWTDIANHFHPPTRQWAGPHSRCYSTLLKPSVHALIQRGTDGRIDLGQADAPVDIESHAIPLPCPAELEPLFASLDKPRYLRQTFVRGASPITGTTYLHPDFCIGSINRGDLWNQRRALLAYYGTAQKPGYLHLRLLKNGYDLAAANFFSTQREGDVLAGITFAIDGGDTHLSLSKLKNGILRAKDLRVRLELGGAGAEADIKLGKTLEDPITIALGKVHVQVQTSFAEMDNTTPKWEVNNDRGTRNLDLVLHHGDEKEFDLKTIDTATIILAIRLSTDPKPAPLPRSSKINWVLTNIWSNMRMVCAFRPEKASQLHARFEEEVFEPENAATLIPGR